MAALSGWGFSMTFSGYLPIDMWSCDFVRLFVDPVRSKEG
jgi:hypothetical protein